MDQRSRVNHMMLINQQLSKKNLSLGRGPFDVQRAATAMKVAACGRTFLLQVGSPSCHKCMAHRFHHHDWSAPTHFQTCRRGRPNAFQKSRLIFQACCKEGVVHARRHRCQNITPPRAKLICIICTSLSRSQWVFASGRCTKKRQASQRERKRHDRKMQSDRADEKKNVCTARQVGVFLS